MLVFGDRIRMISVGGSYCPPFLIDYFTNELKIPIYQGYGLTEHSPMISLNTIDSNRIGSVGKLFSGIQTKISKEDEFMVFSPSLMLGYVDSVHPHSNKISLSSPFDKDGFFNTGDKAYLDNDGYLYITGRTKDEYKLLNGKYVNPIYLESCYQTSAWIEQIFVYANETRTNNHCLVYSSRSNASKSIIEKELENISTKYNINKYEIPNKIHLLVHPLKQEDGYLSLKMEWKRDFVIKNISRLKKKKNS
jgi:long-chain acyl-CoA synthetase